MADEAKNTPATEDKKIAPDVSTEDKKETIGEVLEKANPKVEPEEKPNMIPESVFLAEKKARKALTKELNELKARIDEGAPDKEVSEDIDALADEFDVDPKFLRKLTGALESKLERKYKADLDNEVAPLKEKDKKAKIDEVFERHFTKTMENMTEYKDYVDPEVIKSLSLDPKNAKLTLPELIEKTYSKMLTGKRTIETTTPGGGKEPESIDYRKAKSDPTYYREIMANPTLKKEYNKTMIERIQNSN